MLNASVSACYRLICKLNHNMHLILTYVVTSVGGFCNLQDLSVFSYIYTIKLKFLSAIDTKWTDRKLHNVEKIVEKFYGFRLQSRLQKSPVKQSWKESACFCSANPTVLISKELDWANFQQIQEQRLISPARIYRCLFFFPVVPTHLMQISINVFYNE